MIICCNFLRDLHIPSLSSTRCQFFLKRRIKICCWFNNQTIDEFHVYQFWKKSIKSCWNEKQLNECLQNGHPLCNTGTHLFCTQKCAQDSLKMCAKSTENQSLCAANIRFGNCKYIARFILTLSFQPSVSFFHCC